MDPIAQRKAARPVAIRRFLVVAALAGAAHRASAQRPTVVDYTLTVDSAASGVTVEMTVHGAPSDFRVAMVAHPEYDDEYWRYVVDLRGESADGAVVIAREDSSLWHVTAPAGDVTLRYRVRYPPTLPAQQAVWKAHLTPTGGLVGGPHSFIYMIGAEHVPVRVTVTVPDGWHVVTGLATTGTTHHYAASGTEQLVDSPMLVGLIRRWPFDVTAVRHGISYLGRANGVPFDTARFVAMVERLARATEQMFGSMPYGSYEFLFEDGAVGALEHMNSVSLGAPSTELARDPGALLGEIAHEFFHTWNEVHVRPSAWIGVHRTAPGPSDELWWSEGVTLYYSDLNLRRAGLRTPDATRAAHLARVITNWLGNPSNAAVSPERTSRAFNRPVGTLGDFTPSLYTQGEVLGNVLDLMIREGSDGTRSLDDAMRTLSSHFSMEHGFTDDDVERAVAAACSCDARPFFDAHVREAGAMDFNRWLGGVGLRATVTSAPALAADGTPAPDLRFSANSVPGEQRVQLNVWFPAAPLARAGFHTGDRVVSLNGVAVRDIPAFRQVVARLHIGDTLRVVAARGAVTVERATVISGYERPVVHVEVRPDATPAQRKLLEQWMAGR